MKCIKRLSLLKNVLKRKTSVPKSTNKLIKKRFSSVATTSDYISLEDKYGTHNYHPIPVVIESASGTKVTDVDGKEYMDFLSAYSAVNQGHNHPKIILSMIEQTKKLSLTSRAFHNNKLGEYCKYMTDLFGYSKLLPANSGVEACEGAVKLTRRWGYQVKKIPQNKAEILLAKGNFWGRTITAISTSTDPVAYTDYGPYTPGFKLFEYNNLNEMSSYIVDNHTNIAGIMLEPIQGEAGVVIPSKEYLQGVRKLCDDYNIILLFDEVQTGLGRCGQLTCGEGVFGVKPDLVTLGKALSGGIYPISAVLGRDDIMSTMTPGSHGSTYGGNPLACAIAMSALDVLLEENMIENSRNMGEILLNGLESIKSEFDIVTTVRGRGLFCAIEIKADRGKNVNAWEVCMEMKKNGLLAKPTQDHTIRLSPPLIITKKEIQTALDILRQSIKTISERC